MSARSRRSTRQLAGLGAAIVAYALLAIHVGAVRWDGIAPQPYRYASPPPGVQNGGAPSSAKIEVALTPAGSSPDQAFTDDLQAQLLLPTGVFAGPAGGHVTITIVPSAPPNVPGAGLVGNVYTLTAVRDDGKPAEEPWKQTADLYLRNPLLDTPAKLYLLHDGKATEVEGSKYEQSTGTVLAKISRGGQYVVGITPGAGPSPLSSPLVGALAAFALVLIAAAISLLIGRSGDRGRRGRRPRRA